VSTEEWRHPCFLSELVRRQRAGTHCTTRSLESAHAGSSSGLSTLMWAPDCSLICLMITPPLHSRSHARHQAPASWAGYFHGGRLSTLGSTTDIDNDKLSARHRKMLQLHDRVYTEGSCAHAGGVLLCLLIVLRLVCLLSIIYGNSAATQQLRFAVVPRSWCKRRRLANYRQNDQAGGALADDAASLGVADQQARQVAVRAAAAAAGHRLLALHGQLVYPIQPPLQTVPRRLSEFDRGQAVWSAAAGKDCRGCRDQTAARCATCADLEPACMKQIQQRMRLASAR